MTELISLVLIVIFSAPAATFVRGCARLERGIA